jgi:hypothetical protein
MDACPTSILLLTLIHLLSSISARDFLSAGSTLSVQQGSDVLHSPDGTFTCGFYNISPNSSTFSIWFSKVSERSQELLYGVQILSTLCTPGDRKSS